MEQNATARAPIARSLGYKERDERAPLAPCRIQARCIHSSEPFQLPEAPSFRWFWLGPRKLWLLGLPLTLLCKVGADTHPLLASS